MSRPARARFRATAATLALCLIAPGRGAPAELRALDMSEDGPRVRLTLTAVLDAPPASVFAVITDYEHLAQLHRHILESRVVDRIDARTVDVYTRVRGCVAAVFCRRFARVERLHERPPEELRSEVLPAQSDFAYGTVIWRLRPAGAGTLVEYETEVEPEFWVPKLLGRPLLASFLRRTTTEMIERVEALALERPAGAGADPDPAPAEAATEGKATGGRP